MKLHGNAALTPKQRLKLAKRVVEEDWSLSEAAEAAGITGRTAYRWLARWRAEGEHGLVDRSSAPKRIPHRIAADRVEAIEALRRLRMTAVEIAWILSMALSTVSAWLKRIGLGKRSALAPPNRYERARPGELVHVDIKKLGRFDFPGHRVTGRKPGRKTQTTAAGRGRGVVGWEFVHVCVDDATRLAYVEVLPDERSPSASGFLRRAVEWFSARGIRVERVMSDNGSCYRSRLKSGGADSTPRHLRTSSRATTCSQSPTPPRRSSPPSSSPKFRTVVSSG